MEKERKLRKNLLQFSKENFILNFLREKRL